LGAGQGQREGGGCLNPEAWVQLILWVRSPASPARRVQRRTPGNLTTSGMVRMGFGLLWIMHLTLGTTVVYSCIKKIPRRCYKSITKIKKYVISRHDTIRPWNDKYFVFSMLFWGVFIVLGEIIRHTPNDTVSAVVT